jgi:hypothetical protein
MPERNRDMEWSELLKVAHQNGLPDNIPMTMAVPTSEQSSCEVRIVISEVGSGTPDANP